MKLRVGIDIGGTFTDLVAVSDDGIVTTRKIASTPSDYGQGIIAGLQALLADQVSSVADVLHATTVGSNTVLEMKGAKTALITTKVIRNTIRQTTSTTSRQGYTSDRISFLRTPSASF